MNKEELIQLREKLEKENRRYVPFGIHPTLTGGTDGEYISKSYRLGEIKTKKLDDKAVSAITNNFEAMIIYLAKRKVLYDEIDIVLLFNVFVENDGSIDIKSDKLRRGNRILDDYALLKIYGSIVKSDNKTIEIPTHEIKGYIGSNSDFIVDFYSFVQKLNEQGFTLRGLSDFTELKSKVMNEKSTECQVAFKFVKKNNKTL